MKRPYLVASEYSTQGAGFTASDLHSGPRTWFDAIQMAADQNGFELIRGPNLQQLIRPSTVVLSWAPSITPIVASLLGRHVIYLCWGMPERRSSSFGYVLRKGRLLSLLRSVRTLVTNDDVTNEEMRTRLKRSVGKLDQCVDFDFYRVSGAQQREDFVLVPGTSGRDEALVARLGSRGMRIIRISESPAVEAFHASSENVTCKRSVSFSELRSLYARASVVALPLSADNHAAGQTSMLEALAAAAPIVITRGRASSIASQYPSVRECEGVSVDAWERAISEIDAECRKNADLARRTMENARLRHHVDSVAAQLGRLLAAAR